MDRSDESAVAYPFNLIDRGAQKYRTLIQGRLKALIKQQTNDKSGERRMPSKAPYILVVNGNPMPLYTGDDGYFVRPYAFGSGSEESHRLKPIITARVTTIYNENTLRERRETQTVPLRKIGDLLLVKSFRW